MRIREKRRVVQLLQSATLSNILAALEDISPSEAVNPLFAGICSSNEKTRWHAILAMGPTVARLAEREMEAARVVMRRFMWSLNDESGGIGWGAPEAMAECMVRHDKIYEEYGHMLVAYMREDGWHLEYEPLQAGLMWGTARLASFRRKILLAKEAPRYLQPFLESPDANVRGLAAFGLGLLQTAESVPKLKKLAFDSAPVRSFLDGKIMTTSVASLARRALALLNVPVPSPPV